MKYLVKNIKVLSDAMYQVFLTPDDQSLDYLSGQYLNIIPSGFEPRPFSIANAPQENAEIELHIRHLPIPYSEQLLTDIKVKKQLHLEGPLGNCIYQQDCSYPIIFMAGGVGFAPIKAIIECAIANHDTRPMHLYWGVKTSSDLYLNELAESWARDYPHIQYTPVLSTPETDIHWQGQVGLVHEVIAKDYPDLSHYQLYASGPPKMVFAGKELFEKQGLQAELFYSDLL